MTFARIASRVKPSPVSRTIVLFDATKPHILPFCGKTPTAKPVAPITFSATGRRLIDDARRDAYADAYDALGAEFAEEYAADAAERFATNLLLGRNLPKPVRAAQGKRAPYTAADSLWAFQNLDEPDWDAMADAARSQDLVSAGCSY